MKNSAVYCIKNLINGKIYIGSSKNVFKRKREHFNDLKKGTHHCKHLQRAFNYYGEKYFFFCIVEYCSTEKLLLKELRWFQYYNNGDDDKCYNASQYPTSPMKGKKHTLKTREMFSKMRKGNKFSKEHKERISKSLIGRKRSPEQRLAMSRARKQRPLSKLQREHLERLNENTKGGNNPNAKEIICLDNNKKYECLQETINIEYPHLKKNSIVRLGRCCKNHWFFEGKRYCFYKEFINCKNKTELLSSYTINGSRLSSVTCLETSEIFMKAKQAAESINMKYSMFLYYLNRYGYVKKDDLTFRRCNEKL